MPYPNEHSARLLDPDLFETCRRTSRKSEGKIYGVLTCKYKPGKTPKGKSDWAEQAFRYPISDWTEAEARAHCEKAGGTFEPAEAEEKVKSTDVYMFAYPIGDIKLTKEHLVDIQLLKLGSWQHKDAPNGVLEITEDLLTQFVENFELEVCGPQLPVDLEHKPEAGHSVGWIQKLWQKAGQLWARINVTDEKVQRDLKNESLKYISASIWMDYQNPKDNETYNVIRSAGFSNYPFIKGMKPAVVNFSEIQATEATPDRKIATQLRLVENQRDQAINGSKILLKEVSRLITQIKLKDRKIEDLKLEFELSELLQNGQATPFELREARVTAQKDPQQVQFWLKRAGERPKNPVGSQLSILVPKRAKGGIGSILELIEAETDPNKHAKILKLATEAIEEQKQKRGIK